MSALAETLLTALVLSSLAALGLRLMPRTPPRARFAVAVAGLAAWLVPWGWIRIALPGAAPEQLPATFSFFGSLTSSAARAVSSATLRFDAPMLTGFALAAAALVALALLVGDGIALRRCLRHWRATSRAADDLRALLPAELAAVPAAIRVVRNSDVAAASGCFRRTVWIGDRHSPVRRELALVHEMCHVRGGDPLWLMALGIVRRAYWWNPLVAHLARQAVLMLESACDHRSAAHIGKPRYAAELASLLLSGAGVTPRLAAGMRAANLDVQRLRMLGEPLRVGARDLALLAALGFAGTAAAMTSVLEPAGTPLRTTAASAELPATPAGQALAALLRSVTGGNTELLNELLGAYTPQELVLPLPRNAPAIGIVSVLNSEPHAIEYVVEDVTSGERYVGRLEVVAGGTAIQATRLEGPL